MVITFRDGFCWSFDEKLPSRLMNIFALEMNVLREKWMIEYEMWKQQISKWSENKQMQNFKQVNKLLDSVYIAPISSEYIQPINHSKSGKWLDP